ncbi:dimethyl sulfone monooxygenase SfnG [Streptomyces sp. MA5143a]|nr:dimethyl sulfone monooxygenase SfnG [Streptomyces sp. MA5143a]
MWQDSSFEDLIQYNDGFRTGLIGTPEQIAERVVAYKKPGVDLFLLGFLHYQEEVEYFGRRVLPLVRELEARLPEAGPETEAGARAVTVPAHA